MKLIGVGYETVHDADFAMNRPHGYGAYLLLVWSHRETIYGRLGSFFYGGR